METVSEIEVKFTDSTERIGAAYADLLRWIRHNSTVGYSAIKDLVEVRYYDTPLLDLAKNHCAFRSRGNGRSFRLKYPVESTGIMLVAREITSKGLFSKIDYLNPFHIHAPIIRRIVQVAPTVELNPDWIRTFEPRIFVRCNRSYHVLTTLPKGERIVGLSLDRVQAHSLPDEKLIYEWDEIEIEAIANTPESLAQVELIAQVLLDRGMVPNTVGKYERASWYLNPTQELD